MIIKVYKTALNTVMSDSQSNAYVTGHPVCVNTVGNLVKILGHKSLMFDFSQIFLSLIQLFKKKEHV